MLRGVDIGDDAKLEPLRSKVAIIDNGVDMGQKRIASNVRRGRSFVSLQQNGWFLPWFTSVHVHGTQMASLVVRVDPNCDLFVYRINSLPGGSIDMRHAIEVCAVLFSLSLSLSLFINTFVPRRSKRRWKTKST